MEEENEKKDIMTQVKEKVEEMIKQLMESDISQEEIETLGELVDVHKDISNEEYWKEKESDFMRYGMNYGNYNGYGNYGNYGNSGNYGRGGNYGDYSAGSNYGEYGEGSYGRRGRDKKYRGDDELERMSGEYGRYQENRERYGAGSQEGDKSFHYMVKALEDFIKVLEEEAESPQQKQQLMQSLQNSMR